MNIKYFQGVSTIEELKKSYRKLAKTYHPDLNRDTDTTKIMQEINNEYEFLFSRLGTEQDTKAGHTVNDNYREVINQLLKFEGIEIDLIGSWIWIKGNTYSIKEQLKELGFKWSKNNKAWYLGELSQGKKKGSLTYEQKVEKYGKQTIKGTSKQYKIS